MLCPLCLEVHKSLPFIKEGWYESIRKNKSRCGSK